MVDFAVTVDLPGASSPKVFTPSFADAEPTKIDVSSTRRTGLVSVAIWAVVAIGALIVLVVLRRAFTRARR
jgi:hypothetical protein